MDAEPFAGVLLVRVWGETPAPGELRYRIVVAEPDQPGHVRSTGAGTANLLAAVGGWLDALTSGRAGAGAADDGATADG